MHVKKEEGEKVWERYQLWACEALTLQIVSVKLGQILNSNQNNLEFDSKFDFGFDQFWVPNSNSTENDTEILHK